MKLLNVLTVKQLNEHLKMQISQLEKTTTIKTQDAFKYILAQDVYAIDAVPQFVKSRVDGYALNTQSTMGASTTIPTILHAVSSISIGEANETTLMPNQCQYLNTGSMLPKGANAVVMIENTEMMDDEVLIYKTLAQHENTTKIGEDIQAQQCLLKKNTLLDERGMALLISSGVMQVEVYQKLKCVIISSGNELVDTNDALKMGQVRDVNTILIKQALLNKGFDVIMTQLIKDDLNLYEQALSLCDADIYITSGGSSQGNEDYTYDVFNKLTNNIICHGLAIKPGKPTIVAHSEQKLYIGLPGNPVSAYIVLLQTLIASYQQLHQQENEVVYATLQHNISSSAGKETVILVELNKDEQIYIAKPIYYQSSHLKALADADGYFIIDANTEGVFKDERIEVILL